MDKNERMCPIVQDLLPTYIDGLTSEDTSRMIEEHIADCEDCRKILEDMRSGQEGVPGAGETDRKELDFLRKNRTKNRRAVLIGMIAVLALTAAVIFAKLYIIGSEYSGAMICRVEAEGSQMTYEAVSADSVHVIKKVKFTMEDGVVKGTPYAVLPSFLNRGGSVGHAQADEDDLSVVIALTDVAEYIGFTEDIREIWIGDRLYWADGREITDRVSAVYNAGHDYIGDAPANGAVLEALDFHELFGPCTNELQTETEPYAWKIIFEEDLAKYHPDYLDGMMTKYGYILIGSVGNLSEVEFEYLVGGKTVAKKVTAEEATEFLGRDIKDCRKSAGALSELMEKAGIN